MDRSVKNKNKEQQINEIVSRLEKVETDFKDENYSFLSLRESVMGRAKLFTLLCFANLVVGACTAYIATSDPIVRAYTSSYTAEVHPMIGLDKYESEDYYDIKYVDEDTNKVLRISKQDLENL